MSEMSETTQTTQQQPIRVWAPKIGDRVRLRTFDTYSRLGLPAWTTLHVKDIDPCVLFPMPIYATCVRSLTANGEHDGELVTVPIGMIETPIGWQERYTITVAPDKLADVLSWFRNKRGIAVLQSHYMPSCPTAFAPADNHGTADWRFNGADVDVVDAEMCDQVFRVVKLETTYDICAPARFDKACPTCKGSKTTKAFADFTVVEKDAERVGYPAGTRVLKGARIQCWNCGGKGIRPQYLSELTRREKKEARAELKAQGWDVRYVNAGAHSYWVGERETVVKEFGQSVPPAPPAPTQVSNV